jgi:hypothetical protein
MILQNQKYICTETNLLNFTMPVNPDFKKLSYNYSILSRRIAYNFFVSASTYYLQGETIPR